ncbi:cytochrome P450 [Candidatus Bathyarchaeota archaeon]|nr:cytochrome P450 [Candidatus Bathyarchaeota archaeon]
MLSTHPEALQKVRQEHDELFGQSFDGTLASLEDDPDKLQKLDYTTAVVHETLRLFSVGLAVRDPRPDM